MNLAEIQQELRKQKLDGWLFFDHHLRDPLAYRILGLTPGKGPSRRWYYMIPAEGEPKGMEHRIERNQLAGLPGEKIAYSSWTEQVAALGRLTAGMKRVAMAYSPMCAVPYVAIVDAGTVELVRSLGVDVVTAAELIQIFEARWTPAALETHLEAGRRVDKVRAAAFELIRERTRNGAPLEEVEVKDFVRKGFADAGLLTDQRADCGMQCQRQQSALRAERQLSLRRSRAATGCCWTCGPSWISRARFTTTSPGRRFAGTIRPTRCVASSRRCATHATRRSPR